MSAPTAPTAAPTPASQSNEMNEVVQKLIKVVLGYPGALMLGIVSIVLFLLPISTVHSPVDNIGKYIFMPIFGMFLLYVVGIMYFLQDTAKTMHTAFVLALLTFAISYSAIAVSAINN